MNTFFGSVRLAIKVLNTNTLSYQLQNYGTNDIYNISIFYPTPVSVPMVPRLLAIELGIDALVEGKQNSFFRI